MRSFGLLIWPKQKRLLLKKEKDHWTLPGGENVHGSDRIMLDLSKDLERQTGFGSVIVDDVVGSPIPMGDDEAVAFRCLLRNPVDFMRPGKDCTFFSRNEILTLPLDPSDAVKTMIVYGLALAEPPTRRVVVPDDTEETNGVIVDPNDDSCLMQIVEMDPNSLRKTLVAWPLIGLESPAVRTEPQPA